ncbi:MAG: hypothetical protein HY308_04570 [Gammaproteobacteria bacterium]|nr:hypothetical protein [Gammaproteobacteria bacterium]
MKVRELKILVEKLDDDAEVIITMNSDGGAAYMTQSASPTDEGDLAIDIIHYCRD